MNYARTKSPNSRIFVSICPQDAQKGKYRNQSQHITLALAEKLAAFFAQKTPIGGMFLADQTTYPGYGVSAAAMSGILAAEALMRSEKS